MESQTETCVKTAPQSRNEALRILKVLRRLAFALQRLANLGNRSPVENLTLVDIGASYFLHKPWIPLILGGRAKLISVDPNSENLTYLDFFPRIDVQKVPAALSSESGTRTLYVTNVDSGSSLFPPNPSHEDLLRSPELHNYLFPVREVTLEVSTLDLLPISNGHWLAIKIDTQGAELEILRGASGLLRNGRILSVEAEISLLSRPIMAGSPNFSDISSFLDQHQFELIWIRPTSPVKSNFKTQIRQSEADALFLRRKEQVIDSGSTAVRAYRAILESYGLSQELEVLDAMVANQTLSA